MTISSDFKLIKIADECMLVPVGNKAVTFKGVISVSKTAYSLLNSMQEPKSKTDLMQILIQTFEIDEETARNDLERFLEKLINLGVLEE